MKTKLLYLIISIFLGLNSIAICQTEGKYSEPINDGPYIFYEHHKLKVKWITNNVMKTDNIIPDNFEQIKNKFNLLFSYNDLINSNLFKSGYIQSYNMIDSIGVISDIHGEYNTYINLLKSVGVIDNNLNWKFGKGHLVVLGDTFDRGNMVTEVLWHLFGLEKQAAEAGGQVHVLLGNHELLILSKNLTFMNPKYKRVEEISDTKYFDLYSGNSILGKWLRSRPVAITINNIIFVHAGFSIELVRRNLKIKQINQIFSDKIIGRNLLANNENNEPKRSGENNAFSDKTYEDDLWAIHENEELTFLNNANGPLWYRGYFTDPTFCESRLDSILNFYGKKYIVVGHTTSDNIKPLFNNKVFGVDAGIMNKQPGEMLLYKNGIFYKCYITGARIRL
jgi:hypothetical protein